MRIFTISMDRVSLAVHNNVQVFIFVPVTGPFLVGGT